MQEPEERLNALLAIAIKENVSDIHFTLQGQDLIIELRIGRKMKQVPSFSSDKKLLPYLQYRANLDIGNVIKPQTGQFVQIIDGQSLSLRYAHVSRLDFSAGVLRILNRNLQIRANSLSLLKWQNKIFASWLKEENGLILLSGATGSGKTTALYALLDAFEEKKIYTLEDPIEVYSDSYVQLQISEKSGFDYSEGIKQVLRHDPDVLMIGEIRDEKAAKAAIRAANTGHLVLSSIHSSSACLCIERMIELGVSPISLYDVLLAVTCQSLRSTRSGKKIVFYEILDRQGIEHYRYNHCVPNNFLSLKRQIEVSQRWLA